MQWLNHPPRRTSLKTLLIVAIMAVSLFRMLYHRFSPLETRQWTAQLLRPLRLYGASEAAGGIDYELHRSRQRQIRKVCEKYGTAAAYGTPDKIMDTHIRYAIRRGLAVCFSAKIGTTAWSQYLLNDSFPHLLGRAEHLQTAVKDFLALPKFYKREDRLDVLNQTARVLTTRHPFVRVVSAYLDKVRFCNVKGVRCKMQWTSDAESFTHFIDKVIHEVPPTDVLTFEPYDAIDSHWRPVFANCAPCDIDYNFVIKLETFDDEIRPIAHKFGVQLRTEEVNTNSKSAADYALELFKLVPRSLVRELYERYKIDFEMFDYSVEEFLARSADG